MKKVANFFKHIDFVFLDLLALSISFVLGNLFYLGSLTYYNSFIYGTIIIALLFSVVFTLVLFEPYDGILKRDNIEELRASCIHSLYNLIITIIFLYVVKLSAAYSRATVVLTYIIFSILSFCVRSVWKHRLMTKSKQFEKSLMIITDSKRIKVILENINKEKYTQYDIKGICLTDAKEKNKLDGYEISCTYNNVDKFVIENNISEVMFALEPNKVKKSLLNTFLDNGVAVHLRTEDIFGLDADIEKISSIGIFSTYEIDSFSLSSAQFVYLFFKRILDVVISFFGVVFVGFVGLIVFVANRINKDNGPLLYKHLRIGKDGKRFYLYKFRTMSVDADKKLTQLLKDENYKKQWDEYHKLDNDPRITKVGSFLRNSSLDELPQLLNVLKGEMSLIGPRPLAKGELRQHNGLRMYERVKPGITGWWACNGRSNITYKERLELEYYYVRNFSLWLDILILVRTIYCVFKKVGVK